MGGNLKRKGKKFVKKHRRKLAYITVISILLIILCMLMKLLNWLLCLFLYTWISRTVMSSFFIKFIPFYSIRLNLRFYIG